MADLHPHYPVPAEVDAWCDGLLRRADERQVKAQLMDHPTYEFQLGVRHTGGAYVSFKSPGRRTFYGFWQPAPSGRGPILLHVPGYGAEMSAHPELVSSGYNVLHINPLGYATPGGPDTAQQVNETWPVLPNTVTASGEGGYADWLCDAISAARWGIAQDGVEPERFAFFGTSQGGGTALLLASIFRDLGVRCVAADVPFLINIPLSMDKVEWMRDGLLTGLDDGDQAAAWKALGCVDVMSHAHRLSVPTLLTAGQADVTCLPETIRGLFDLLPGTRSYTEVAGMEHGYTPHFLHLAKAWFRLHV